jgi:hypothetical protein
MRSGIYIWTVIIAVPLIGAITISVFVLTFTRISGTVRQSITCIAKSIAISIFLVYVRMIYAIVTRITASISICIFLILAAAIMTAIIWEPRARARKCIGSAGVKFGFLIWSICFYTCP